MRTTTTRALLALAALLLIPSASLGEDAPDLRVLKAKVRFRGGDTSRDALSLELRFRSELLPRDFDPRTERLEVSAGPVPVISLPVEDDRASFRAKDEWRSRYVERPSRERSGVRKLELDLAAGRLRLRARRLDLAALRAAGPDGVTVTLRLGELELTAGVDFVARARSWRYRAPKSSTPFTPFDPGGGGGGGGTPGGGGGPLAFRILWTGSAPPPGAPVARTLTVRTETDYSKEWARHVPPPPPGVGAPVIAPPSVDFTREIVVIVDLGVRPTGGYTVTVVGAEKEGAGARVTWEESKPGPSCAVTQALIYPFVFAAIPRVPGSVSFTGTSKTRSCP